MDGPQLLQALMAAAGENAYAVASSLKKPSLQSYIWKFTNGIAKEPRRATLQPLADRYGVPVEAFYDPALAERLAAERGLIAGVPAAPTIEPQPDRISGALRTLADSLRASDRATRSAVAPLFSLLASDPDQVENVISALGKLLPRVEVARASQHDQSTGLTFSGLGTGGMKPNEQRDRVQARQGKR